MQLLVSFDVVRSRCRCALKKAFLFRLALHELKNRLYRESRKFHYQKALRTSLKAVFYARKLLLHVPFFAVRKNFPFLQTKSLSFAESLANCPPKPPFMCKKSFIRTNFPYSHPKQFFSTLRRPFQRPLTYCLQRIQLFF